jgi:hypothetical protein
MFGGASSSAADAPPLAPEPTPPNVNVAAADAAASDPVGTTANSPPSEERPDISLTEEDDLSIQSKTESVMREYARGILTRLRDELHKDFNESAATPWLLNTLKKNGWWLRAEHARSVMEGLKASSDPNTWANPFYMNDIYVWAPDVRWPDEQVAHAHAAHTCTYSPTIASTILQ